MCSIVHAAARRHGGENTAGFNRVGGGSGGGSGGHIVLSSASYIEVQGIATEGETGTWYQDGINGHHLRPISALGGEGGAGRGNNGGSKFNGVQRPWRCDAIPLSYFPRPEAAFDDPLNPNNPPFAEGCFRSLPDIADPDGLGPCLATGGDGSPGIIQMHVDDPAQNLRFTHAELWTSESQYYGGLDGAALDATMACAPPPLGWNFRDGADRMLPFFGRESISQSKWIPLGLMRVGPDPDGEGGVAASDHNIVRFIFGGITADGAEFGTVDRVPGSERQDFGTPLIAAQDLGASGSTPFIGESEYTIVMDASQLSGVNDMYLRNPQLLRAFSVLIDDGAQQTLFSVESASYDHGSQRLTLTVNSDQSIVDLVGTEAAGAGSSGFQVSLIRHFFLVSTNGEVGSYPAETEIKISMQTAYADDAGNPKESDTWAYTNDVSEFEVPKDVDGTERWPDFIRFKVHFNLNTGGDGVDYSSPRPALEFFRIPVRFGFDSSL